MRIQIPKNPDLADSLRRDTFELCQPEGRVIGTPGHRRAENFVASRLEEIGCVPYRGDSFAMPYEHGGESFTNFAGVIPGGDRSLPPLLIGAHYDSVIEAPCADDNGAAVSICLAAGGILREAGGLERDVVIAIFDAEEPPHFREPSMGSTRFYEDQADDRGFHFAMIYDLVGHDISIPRSMLPGLLKKGPEKDFGVPFLRDVVFMTGSESHPDLPGIAAGTGLPSGLKRIATLNQYPGDMSDHGVFRENGVPYLFFSCGRWEHYHQPTDTPDRLNYRKMARLTELSLRLVEQIAAAELEPGYGEFDPVEFEIATFRESLGILYPAVCRWAGVKGLESREDVDALAGRLLSTGL